MHDDDLHFGLAHDLEVMNAMNRRSALRWITGGIAGAALAPLVASLACDDSGKAAIADADAEGASDTTTGETVAETTAETSAETTPETSPEVVTSCEEIPPETGGPYPGDGSNGANALALSGIVRSDIRTSLGNLSGTAEGVPLTVRLQLVDQGGGCAPLVGYAVYIWHCDRAGEYSMYTLTTQNYLRGVQVTDADGVVSFTSIFPACYPGRWPHIHFEVYPNVDAISSARNAVATSQLALPKTACDEAFATAGYEASVGNLSRISLASDNVFSDGAALQIPTMSGGVADGYFASLVVGVT